MKNKRYRIQKDLLLLTASMFIIVSLWIAFNVYDTFVTTTINKSLQIQIIPIKASFDIDTINNIKSRTAVQPDYSTVTGSSEASVFVEQPTAENTQSRQDNSNNLQFNTPAASNSGIFLDQSFQQTNDTSSEEQMNETPTNEGFIQAEL